VQTYVDGLPFHAADIDFVRPTFSYLLAVQEDLQVRELADRLLGEVRPPLGTASRLIALAGASARYHRGDFAGAEAMIARFELIDSLDALFLRVRMAWERGDREEAFMQLRDLLRRRPDDARIYQQLARYLHEAGREDDRRRLALIRQISYPDEPYAYLDLLDSRHQTDEAARVETAIEETLRRFGDQEAVLFMLAEFAARTGRPALAQRIYERCVASGRRWELAAHSWVEACLSAHEPRLAREAARQVQGDHPEWASQDPAYFNSLLGAADYALGETASARILVENFLERPELRADYLVGIARHLEAAGAIPLASVALARAVKRDRFHQPAIVRLIELGLASEEIEGLVDPLSTLVRMRKPPVDLLVRAFDTLSSDRFLFLRGRARLLDELRAAVRTADNRSVATASVKASPSS
jgi:tetratricopeptide (TPR) repeat protein